MEMKERRKRTLARLIGDMRTKDFAEQYDLDASYLSQILNGHRGMGEKAARTMEMKIGLPEGTFLHPSMEDVEGEPAVRQGQESNVIAADFSSKKVGMVDIPRLNVAGSMGNGLTRPEDYEDVIDRMRVSTGWLRRNVNATAPSNLAVITGYGDSMEGTFSDGDLLLVDRGITEIKIDAVYVLSLKGELYIKRLQRRPDGVLLMLSDNEKYKPYEIKNGELEQFEVLGRVLLAWNAKRL